MKILYVAKFGDHDNCDEEAITHALEVLGHQVVRMQEGRLVPHHLQSVINTRRPDFCLYHKWSELSQMEVVSREMPLVCWYFDLISNTTDPTLQSRMASRRRWFDAVRPYTKQFFFTDGDWVKKFDDPSISWLMQGADERTLGLGTACPDSPMIPILFTGSVNHGRDRAAHVQQLRDRYGDKFHVLGDGGPRSRLHGRALANYFASTNAVVAPDGPSTDRYWSNRVYLTLGLGGFLLHPYCSGLVTHQDGRYPQYTHDELRTYYDRQELLDILDDAVAGEEVHREEFRQAGLKATEDRNLYRHRCEDLVSTVRKNLGV